MPRSAGSGCPRSTIKKIKIISVIYPFGAFSLLATHNLTKKEDCICVAFYSWWYIQQLPSGEHPNLRRERCCSPPAFSLFLPRFFSFATRVIGFISVGKTFLAKLWNLFKGIVCIGRAEDRPRISNILFSGQFYMFVYFFSWLLSPNRAHLGHDSKNVIHWFPSVRSYQQVSVLKATGGGGVNV